MELWFAIILRQWAWRLRRQDGQTEIVIAVLLLLLIFMLAGRRVVVQ